MSIFVLMRRLPSRSTRTYTLFPYSTLVRSARRQAKPHNGRFQYVDRGSVYSGQVRADVPQGQTPRRRQVGVALDRLAPMSTVRSEEHTSELQSLMRISYAVFCLHTKINIHNITHTFIFPYSHEYFNSQ